METALPLEAVPTPAFSSLACKRGLLDDLWSQPLCELKKDRIVMPPTLPPPPRPAGARPE